MKKSGKFWFVMLCQMVLALCFSRPALAQDTGLSSYKLGTGDVIAVRVYGEDDLSRDKLRLTDAGTITYPVLGELKVAGMTVGELQKFITDNLKGRYLVNPRVSVTVEEYRMFFVNGQVARPGGYPYQPGLTVRKAVLLAGGLTERASESKIYLIREGDNKQKQNKVDMTIEVKPGDVVTVEESFF